jgi:single-strand DNA-binding protein
MNSFTLTAVGNLARNPELVAKGDTSYARFCLVGNDYAGKDEEGAPREVVTSLWFVAFGPVGERIVRHTRKGDQLIIEARVRASNWIDKQGEKQYDHDFVVQGFRFGAPGKIKREERELRREDGQQREERSNGRDHSAIIVGEDGSRGAGGKLAGAARSAAGAGSGAGISNGSATNVGAADSALDASAGSANAGTTDASYASASAAEANADAANGVAANRKAVNGSAANRDASDGDRSNDAAAKGSTNTHVGTSTGNALGEKPSAGRGGRRAAASPP